MRVPVASIVMATYNRSDVLAHAIQSVVDQTLVDWELLVVGDCCTDDTEQVVASFDDRRIRFVNRVVNHGDQSAPNNDGLALARGRFVALLNHDDLWAPEHLEAGIAALERSAADLASCLYATLAPDRTVFVAGRNCIRRGLLCTGIPASMWVHRRALVDRVGPWRSAFDLCMAPSQDWLIRALDAGARIVCTERITAVRVPSGNRDRAYLRTDPTDTEQALALLAAVRREAPLAQVAGRPDTHPSGGSLKRSLWPIAEHLLLSVGHHPYTAKTSLASGFRRGRFIRRLRVNRGLPPIPDGPRHV